MYKKNSAYMLWDSRKFADIEEVKRELNRLQAICIRLKNKQEEEVNFILGVSVTNTDYIGKMGYDKPKNQGGKKQYICADSRLTWNPETGEKIIIPPPYQTAPHIHIMVQGYGANKCSEHIIKNLRKKDASAEYRRQRLKTPERIAQITSYIEEQSTILRHV